MTNLDKNTKKAMEVLGNLMDGSLFTRESLNSDSDLMKTMIRLDRSDDAIQNAQGIIKKIVLSNLENYNDDDTLRVSKCVKMF